jgi:homoserine dehydrogenase
LHAKNLGYKIKLLAISEIKNKKLNQRVHPALVSINSHLANINGVLNAIIVDGHPIGRSILQGEGAGPGPTSSAIISDLCSVLRGNIKFPFGVSYFSRKSIAKFNISKHISSSYLRIEVKDLPGVLSSITKIFAKNKISIKNLIQVPNKKNKKASMAIITHKSFEQNFNNLLSSLIKNKFVLKKPTFIRIEEI